MNKLKQSLPLARAKRGGRGGWHLLLGGVVGSWCNFCCGAYHNSESCESVKARSRNRGHGGWHLLGSLNGARLSLIKRTLVFRDVCGEMHQGGFVGSWSLFFCRAFHILKV